MKNNDAFHLKNKKTGVSVTAHDRLSVVSQAVDDVEKKLEEEGGASAFAIIFNMCKASTSNGILSTPLAFAYMGVPLAVTMIAWSAFIYGFGYFILGMITQKLKATSYADIWAKSIGPNTTWVVDLFQIGNGFCSCLTFCMIYGKIFAEPFVSQIAEENGFFSHKQVWICLVGVLVVFPVCLPKKLNVLRHTSIIGIVAILFAIGWVGAQGFGHGPYAQRWRGVEADPTNGIAAKAPESGIFDTNPWQLKMVGVLSLLGSAFTGHMNGPRYFYEVKDKSTKNWAFICITAHIALFIVNVFFGLAGLAAIGGKVLVEEASNGNIFSMFGCQADIHGNTPEKPAPLFLYYAVMFCVAFSVMFALPLSFIGARQGLLNISQNCEFTRKRFSGEGVSRIVITAIGLALTFFISCIVHSLTYVNIVKGMLFSISLSSLIPGIIWLRLGKAEYKSNLEKAEDAEEGEVLLGSQRVSILSESAKEKKRLNQLPHKPKWMTVCACIQITQAICCLIGGFIKVILN